MITPLAMKTSALTPQPQPRPSIRTLSIGGSTFDLFVRTDESVVHEADGKDHLSLPLGEKIRISDVISTAGGGAANTSVGLARLGFDASFCGILGEDQWGTILLETFKKEGVSTDAATIVDKETSSFSLILSSKSGERVILNHPGTARHLHDVTFDREAIGKVDAVFLNHIHRESCVIQDDIIDAFRKNPQVHLSWNPGGCQIELGMEEEHNNALLSETNLLFLNKEEAFAFTHSTGVQEAMEKLLRAGVDIICITDGKNGSVATDGISVYDCPIVEGPVVDTTGAGDAFGTGVTWGILSGKDLPTSLLAGTINARSVVSVIGAQKGLLTADQMQAELN